ncbi:MAG: hypothetical protein LQ346_000747 [Caloplaca aetnensis]|nr:MAG: hypothetical protein LQ346_000747 [Caloplaca aetnensis]
MAGPPDTRRQIFPFLKPPPEIRNDIDRRCLRLEPFIDTRNQPDDEDSDVDNSQFDELEFDPKILNISHQIREEAVSMLPGTLRVSFEILVRGRIEMLGVGRQEAYLTLPMLFRELLGYVHALPPGQCQMRVSEHIPWNHDSLTQFLSKQRTLSSVLSATTIESECGE